MRKKLLVLFAAGVMATSLLAGCSCSSSTTSNENGTTTTTQKTDSNGTTTTTTTTTTSKTPVKPQGDLTFADLQTNYGILVDCYNEVEKLYMDKQIQQDDQVENLLAESKKVIEEMGQLQESDFKSQEDYQKMNDSMVTMIEALGKIVDSMQVVQ